MKTVKLMKLVYQVNLLNLVGLINFLNKQSELNIDLASQNRFVHSHREVKSYLHSRASIRNMKIDQDISYSTLARNCICICIVSVFAPVFAPVCGPVFASVFAFVFVFAEI